MSSLSQAPPLEGLPPSHGTFQEHAVHITRWPVMLSSKGSSDTCISEAFRHSYRTLSQRTNMAHNCGYRIRQVWKGPRICICANCAYRVGADRPHFLCL